MVNSFAGFVLASLKQAVLFIYCIMITKRRLVRKRPIVFCLPLPEGVEPRILRMGTDQILASVLVV
jgi:hypothetical protein